MMESYFQSNERKTKITVNPESCVHNNSYSWSVGKIKIFSIRQRPGQPNIHRFSLEK